MGGDALEKEWEDDWDAWMFLRSRGHTMNKGVIDSTTEWKELPKDEQEAICYLVGEWDWAYA